MQCANLDMNSISQVKSGSMWQVESQPSPSYKFPSSHCYFPSYVNPSPQINSVFIIVH